jgi:hypothetical protein
MSGGWSRLDCSTDVELCEAMEYGSWKEDLRMQSCNQAAMSDYDPGATMDPTTCLDSSF